jgi:hypothetical protein
VDLHQINPVKQACPRHTPALALVGWYLMVPTRRLERKVRYGETAAQRHK